MNTLGKFEGYQYFKHIDCLDTFIGVRSVVMDSGEKTILYVTWTIQGMEGFWFASNVERVFSKADQYENWLPYEPIGDTVF